MKTDTLFYKIFHTFPHLVFELLGRPVVAGYQFSSVEVKEKAFRFDGIFMPPNDAENSPIYFMEVQFQYNPNFYWELFSEIGLYLNQQKPEQDWVAVAIFPSRAVDVKNLSRFQQDMVELGRLVQIYLDELPVTSLPELMMLQLITCPPEAVAAVVNRLRASLAEATILEFVKTILVYKFPKLSREEVEKMFTLDDLRQTRIVQEAMQESWQEGRQEGQQEGRRSEALSLLLRQINRKFGNLPADRLEQINSLSIDQLEELAEVLLDFQAITDLNSWLDH